MNITLDNKYKTISIIGEGGFGKVYLARDLRNKSEVVIKEFQCLSDFDDEEANMRELRKH